MSEQDEQHDDAPVTGDEAVAKVAARDEDTTPEHRVEALAFLMGEVPAPNTGDDATFGLNVDVGSYGKPAIATIRFRALTAEQMDQCEELAVDKDPITKVDKGINTFKRACIVMAMAQVDPPIGPILQARNQAGGQFRDATHLLMDTFARAPGIPMHVEQHIRLRSRTGFDDDRAVREIAAGKG